MAQDSAQTKTDISQHKIDETAEDNNSPDPIMLEEIEFPNNKALISVCGPFDRNLAQIEKATGVMIARRGNIMTLNGAPDQRADAITIVRNLYERIEDGLSIGSQDVDTALRMQTNAPDQAELFGAGRLQIKTRKKVIEPRSPNQRKYVKNLFDKELVFGAGPAGTGKTYLAVAVGVSMFLAGKVDKIILSRPAVEAGERLGFLPGDMKEKVDPYLRPLYDALEDMLPAQKLARAMEEGLIEVAPLAFMRGRTLSHSYVVLDEAQNCTEMQMKMFLTRLGEGSRMAVTGDTSQIDLPRGVNSGLVEALRLLDNVKGISQVHFTDGDVVRHPLVARIIRAYATDSE